MSINRPLTPPDSLQRRLQELKRFKLALETQKDAFKKKLEAHQEKRATFRKQILQKNTTKLDSNLTADEKSLNNALYHEDFEIAKLNKKLSAEKCEIKHAIKEIVSIEDEINDLPFPSRQSSSAIFQIKFEFNLLKSKKRKNEIAYLNLPNETLKHPLPELQEYTVAPTHSNEKISETKDLETNPVTEIHSDSNSTASTELSNSPHKFFSSKREKIFIKEKRNKKNSDEDKNIIDTSTKDKAEIYYNRALDTFETLILITRDNFNYVSNYYNKAINDMHIAATIFRSLKRYKDLRITLLTHAKKLEKTADFLVDQSTLILKDTYPDKNAKIDYFKLAGSFYQKAIMLRTSADLSCKFSLYLSPLFIYYKLAHVYSVNLDSQLRLMRNHMRHHRLHDLVNQVAKENQKKEFQEYVDFVNEHEFKPNNLSLQK